MVVFVEVSRCGGVCGGESTLKAPPLNAHTQGREFTHNSTVRLNTNDSMHDDSI